MSDKGLLLAIVEQGGYPDFTALYERLGYKVEVVRAMRKAIQYLKKNTPQVIVAEFNFQSDFRDRTSSLESLIAILQRQTDTRLVVFYDQEYAHQLARLQGQHRLHATLPFPIDMAKLEAVLR